MLVEGSSIRSVSRINDVTINTIMKLLVEVGKACLDYQDKVLRNVPSDRVQVDELWSFCYAKKDNLKNATNAPEDAGDVWTWIALCADTKMVFSWWVGDRKKEDAMEFMKDVASRIPPKKRIQLTSDGFTAYLDAVDAAFGTDIDYAMTVKSPGIKTKDKASADVSGSIEKRVISGTPDPKHIHTNYVERQNLTLRMGLRRYARKTNAHSKKMENHLYALALHFMYYNFARIQTKLRVTPAMEAKLSSHIWTIGEIIDLVPKKVAKYRGPYKRENKEKKN